MLATPSPASAAASILAAAAIAGALIADPRPIDRSEWQRTITRSRTARAVRVEIRSIETRAIDMESEELPDPSTPATATIRGSVAFDMLPTIPSEPMHLLIQSSGTRITRTLLPPGRFDIDGIAPGVARLRVTGRGFIAESHSIRLDPGSVVEPVTLVAEPAPSVLGTVLRSTASHPIRVSWARDEFVPVDGDGSFAIHGLRPGRYPLRLAYQVADRWMTTGLGAIDAVVDATDITAKIPERAGHSLIVELRPPRPGIGVSVERAGATGTAMATATSDSQGRTMFVGLPRSVRSLVRLDVPFTEPATVAVPPSDIPGIDSPQRIDVPPLGALDVRVLDPSGRPLRATAVTLQPAEHDTREWLTNARGLVSIPALPATRYTVSIAGVRLRQPIDMRADQTTILTVTVSGEHHVRVVGTVMDGNQTPVSGAHVSLFHQGVDVSLETTRSDAHGRFEFLVPQDGAFDVVARSHDTRSPGWARVNGLAGGADTPLVLGPPGTIDVALPPRTTAILWSGQVEVRRRRDAAGAGRISFANVTPGSYRVTLEGGSEAVDIDVRSGEIAVSSLVPQLRR